MKSADDSISEAVPALASFVSEATLPRTPPALEQPNPLWQFPEERSVTSREYSAVRRLAIYTALTAATIAAVIAGAWWGASLAPGRPVRTDAVAQSVVNTPIVEPRVDAAGKSPAQLTSSVTVQPSALPPVASVVSTVSRENVDRAVNPPARPVGLSAAEIDTRQSQERTSLARGTAGGTRAAPAPRVVDAPPTDIVAPPAVVAANPAVIPAPEPAPSLELPPAAPAVTARVPPPARPEAEATPSVAARTEQSEIQRALGQYRSAYQRLDAEAARAVWPSVDVRALSRAFDSLTSQQLAFDTCLFEIAGEAATAQCRGSATYTPKVGNRGPKVEARQWTFHLRKEDEGWKIQSAQARR